MSKFSVGVLGCDGRMGKRVVSLLGSEFEAQAELKVLVGRKHSTEDLLEV